ncbi:MAG: serine hydrolase [Woeseiaceae bacterium]|jgi:beta-lactamase class A
MLKTALILFAAGLAAADDLPLTVHGSAQVQLEIVLDELELQDAVDDGRLAVALVVMDGEDDVSLGMVNGHTMLYAASLPKIAILYGAAVALDRGRLTMTEELREDMVAMIRRSCNNCATRVLAKVGRQWLLELLQSDPYRFYNPERGGGLWVGKDYARKGAFQREPLKGLSHAATPWQVARWFYLLDRGLLASPEQTELMLECLSDPAIQHKFVKGLADQPDLKLYRKSGTWRQYHADSILVKDGLLSYILVALAADRRGGRWLENIARRLHERLAEPDEG